MLRAASCQACKNLEKFLPPHSFIYIYIYIYECGGRVYLGIKCSMLW